MTVRQSFVEINNLVENRPQQIAAIFNEVKKNEGEALEDRMLRKLVSLCISVQKKHGLIDIAELQTWISSQDAKLQSFGALYYRYIQSQLHNTAQDLQQIRAEVQDLPMEYGHFAVQRYIYFASLDIVDVETIQILYSKLCQFNGNDFYNHGYNSNTQRAASLNTLAVLRYRLEKEIKHWRTEEQLQLFLNFVKQPYINCTQLKNYGTYVPIWKTTFTQRNIFLESVLYPQADDAIIKRRGNRVKILQSTSPETVFQHVSTEKQAVFSSLSETQITDLLNDYPHLLPSVKKIVSRALVFANCTDLQKSRLLNMAIQSKDADLLVLALFQNYVQFRFSAKTLSAKHYQYEGTEYIVDPNIASHAKLIDIISILYISPKTCLCQDIILQRILPLVSAEQIQGWKKTFQEMFFAEQDFSELFWSERYFAIPLQAGWPEWKQSCIEYWWNGDAERLDKFVSRFTSGFEPELGALVLNQGDFSAKLDTVLQNTNHLYDWVNILSQLDTDQVLGVPGFSAWLIARSSALSTWAQELLITESANQRPSAIAVLLQCMSNYASDDSDANQSVLEKISTPTWNHVLQAYPDQFISRLLPLLQAHGSLAFNILGMVVNQLQLAQLQLLLDFVFFVNPSKISTVLGQHLASIHAQQQDIWIQSLQRAIQIGFSNANMRENLMIRLGEFVSQLNTIIPNLAEGLDIALLMQFLEEPNPEYASILYIFIKEFPISTWNTVEEFSNVLSLHHKELFQLGVQWVNQLEHVDIAKAQVFFWDIVQQKSDELAFSWFVQSVSPSLRTAIIIQNVEKSIDIIWSIQAKSIIVKTFITSMIGDLYHADAIAQVKQEPSIMIKLIGSEKGTFQQLVTHWLHSFEKDVSFFQTLSVFLIKEIMHSRRKINWNVQIAFRYWVYVCAETFVKVIEQDFSTHHDVLIKMLSFSDTTVQAKGLQIFQTLSDNFKNAHIAEMLQFYLQIPQQFLAFLRDMHKFTTENQLFLVNGILDNADQELISHMGTDLDVLKHAMGASLLNIQQNAWEDYQRYLKRNRQFGIENVLYMTVFSLLSSERLSTCIDDYIGFLSSNVSLGQFNQLFANWTWNDGFVARLFTNTDEVRTYETQKFTVVSDIIWKSQTYWHVPQVQQQLLYSVHPVLQSKSLQVISQMVVTIPNLGEQIFAQAVVDLDRFIKIAPVAHTVALFEYVFEPMLHMKLTQDPIAWIKYIDEVLFNQKAEDFHRIGMLCLNKIPPVTLKEHATYLILSMLDHRSNMIRSQLDILLQKWRILDPDWVNSLLLRALFEIAPKAKRVEVLKILETYLSAKVLSRLATDVKHRDYITKNRENFDAFLSNLVMHPESNADANHVDAQMTKSRLDLGLDLVGNVPVEWLTNQAKMLVYLVVHENKDYRAFAEPRILELLKLPAPQSEEQKTAIGNALVVALKSEVKYTAKGANIFNFHFYPNQAEPQSLNDYILERRSHGFPDFDEALIVPPKNVNILIGPNIDDQNKDSDIGFSFRYGQNTYTKCTVDSNGWLKFSGNFSGSTFRNDTAYDPNTANMLFIWWQDLRTAHDGYLRTWMYGDNGARVRVYDWRVWAVYTQSSKDNRTLNMQICLHEGTNEIVYRFGPSEPHGSTTISQTAACGAKIAGAANQKGIYRDFFGTHGDPVGSVGPFRKDLACQGDVNKLDYPGMVMDKNAVEMIKKEELERYKRAMALLQQHCQSVLSVLNLADVAFLLEHPKDDVREFAGKILQSHQVHPDNFPSTMLLSMLLAQDKKIQVLRDQIFPRLTLQGLKNHQTLWVDLLQRSGSYFQQRGTDNLQQIIRVGVDCHVSILKSLLSHTTLTPASISILSSIVPTVHKIELMYESELMLAGYFHPQENTQKAFAPLLRDVVKISREVALTVWNSSLQKEKAGTLSSGQKLDLPLITEAISEHLSDIDTNELLQEDWWVPQLTSTIEIVRETLAPLLGRYAMTYPNNAIQCARNIVTSITKQIGQNPNVPPNQLQGYSALQNMITMFAPDRKGEFSGFWSELLVVPHLGVRMLGQRMVMEILRSPPEYFQKRMMDHVLRRILQEETFVGMHAEICNLLVSQASLVLAIAHEPLLLKIMDVTDTTRIDFALVVMAAKYRKENITLEQMELLAKQKNGRVRQYALRMISARTEFFKKNPVSIVSFLESSWSDVQAFAKTFAQNELSASWNVESIIRICDSNLDEIRTFGLNTLRRFLLGSADGSWQDVDVVQLSDIAQKLSQHPSMEVEKFLMNLFQEYQNNTNAPPLLGRPEQLQLLEPCFKRIYARVNKHRLVKEKVWGLLTERSLESFEHAKVVYPLLSWMSASHLKKDKFQSIQLMFAIHQKYPEITTVCTTLDVPMLTVHTHNIFLSNKSNS